MQKYIADLIYLYQIDVVMVPHANDAVSALECSEPGQMKIHEGNEDVCEGTTTVVR